MRKEELISTIKEYGDAIVTYRSSNSGKQKYNACTLDFTTPYIKNKTSRAQEKPEELLVWAWDTDSFRLLKPENVISVVPLAAVLRN